ncbi:MAG TPA: sugar ABC transporter permease [Candidatus Hydrogenedentes bacterium]|nr:sugar ABC transporter permease [Candidatus Hydrogenedentota bacterium]
MTQFKKRLQIFLFPFVLLAVAGDRCLGMLDDGLDALRRHGLGDWPAALLLLLPAVILLSLFSLYPMGASLQMSFFGGRHGEGDFVGLANYTEALNNPDFRRSFLVTLYYVLGVVPLTVSLSFIIAFGLFKITRGRGLLRSLYFLPYVTSAVAAAMVWRSLFHPQQGVVNLLFSYLGFSPQNWLLEPRGILHLLSHGWIPADLGPSLGLCCIMLFDIWHGSGFMIAVFLAGLSVIPRELEEAARMDGAGEWRLMWHVTLPLLSPTIFFLSIVGVIKAFQAFNSFYALTHAGGLPDTQNLILYVYAQFYQYGYWGYGAAVATLLVLVIVALTLLQWRVLGRKVFYS